MIALCYLDALSVAHMRYSVRRLKRRLPGIPILLCCWTMERADLDAKALKEEVRADLVATDMKSAVRLIVERAMGGGVPAKVEATTPKVAAGSAA